MGKLHQTGRVYQMAFLVRDPEVSARSWQQRGAGPFYRFDDFVFGEMLYPSGSTSPKLSILLGYSGDTMIELIKVTEDPTGIFSAVEAPAPHHVALLVDDIDSYLDSQDCRHQLVMHGLFPTGTPIAMLDTRAETGLFTELVTRDDSVKAMTELMHNDALHFSGDGLLRSFA